MLCIRMIKFGLILYFIVQVDLNDMGSQISGGGLPRGTFVAQQFHFHWGAIDARGSEHSVNDLHFPMEVILHFILFLAVSSVRI